MNDATRIEDQIKAQMLDELTRKSNEFLEQIVVEPSHDVARLPEDIFKTNFLPFFSGERSLADAESTIAIWIGIAGRPQAEVAIINSQNEELFRVPPIVDTTAIDVLKRRPGNSFSDIAALSTLYSNNLPRQGDLYLATSIDHKFGEIVDHNAPTHKERWDAILERYGKKPKTTQEDRAINTQDDDLIDYDDT